MMNFRYEAIQSQLTDVELGTVIAEERLRTLEADLLSAVARAKQVAAQDSLLEDGEQGIDAAE